MISGFNSSRPCFCKTVASKNFPLLLITTFQRHFSDSMWFLHLPYFKRKRRYDSTLHFQRFYWFVGSFLKTERPGSGIWLCQWFFATSWQRFASACHSSSNFFLGCFHMFFKFDCPLWPVFFELFSWMRVFKCFNGSILSLPSVFLTKTIDVKKIGKFRSRHVWLKTLNNSSVKFDEIHGLACVCWGIGLSHLTLPMALRKNNVRHLRPCCWFCWQRRLKSPSGFLRVLLTSGLCHLTLPTVLRNVAPTFCSCLLFFIQNCFLVVPIWFCEFDCPLWRLIFPIVLLDAFLSMLLW